MENELAVLMQLGVDISMIVRRYSADDLATREIAILLAEELIKLDFGKDELDRQRPLIIGETPDRWTIEGSRRPEIPSVRDNRAIDGKVEMEIRKIDCQVLKFSRQGILAPPPYSTDDLANASD